MKLRRSVACVGAAAALFVAAGACSGGGRDTTSATSAQVARSTSPGAGPTATVAIATSSPAALSTSPAGTSPTTVEVPPAGSLHDDFATAEGYTFSMDVKKPSLMFVYPSHKDDWVGLHALPSGGTVANTTPGKTYEALTFDHREELINLEVLIAVPLARADACRGAGQCRTLRGRTFAIVSTSKICCLFPSQDRNLPSGSSGMLFSGSAVAGGGASVLAGTPVDVFYWTIRPSPNGSAPVVSSDGSAVPESLTSDPSWRAP